MVIVTLGGTNGPSAEGVNREIWVDGPYCKVQLYFQKLKHAFLYCSERV